MDTLHNNSAVSWGAILAGGLTAAAATLIIVAFGTGAGLSVVSPWEGQGISATTAGWAAGLFLLATSMIASTVGGYITGRLRFGWEDVHTDERYFRDTAHGVVAWAFATLLTVTILGSGVAHIISGASAGVLRASGPAALGPSNRFADGLLRNGPNAPATTQGDQREARDELIRVIAPATTKNGSVSADDRTYAARVVAARTGLSPEDAQKRVDDTITQAKAAADKARHNAAVFAFWVAASLLAGALASALGAVEGGKLRSSRWYETTAASPRATTVRS